MDIDAFSIRRIATTGHEILDRDGTVIAWAVDEAWAALIAGLLNRVEVEGLCGLFGAAAECGRSGIEDLAVPLDDPRLCSASMFLSAASTKDSTAEDETPWASGGLRGRPASQQTGP